MAKGKFQRKGSGTSTAGPAINSWVGSPAGASSSTPARRAGRAELPALGVATMSPWGWRILVVFAMVALGLCLTFFIDAKTVFGALWALIALAWGGFSLKLWRDHLHWDRQCEQVANGPL